MADDLQNPKQITSASQTHKNIEVRRCRASVLNNYIRTARPTWWKQVSKNTCQAAKTKKSHVTLWGGALLSEIEQSLTNTCLELAL